MANLRICGCGNRYYSHSDRPLKGPVICSACRNVNRWRECEHCGSKFLAKWRNDPKVYCSTACMGAAKKVLWERPCLECGTMYKPKRKSARWCSEQCAGIGRRKPEVPCAWCGELFWGRKGAKYCGRACAGKAKRKKARTSPVCGLRYYADLMLLYKALVLRAMIREAREWHVRRAVEFAGGLGMRPHELPTDSVTDLVSLNLRYGLRGELMVETARRYGVPVIEVQSSPEGAYALTRFVKTTDSAVPGSKIR